MPLRMRGRGGSNGTSTHLAKEQAHGESATYSCNASAACSLAALPSRHSPEFIAMIFHNMRWTDACSDDSVARRGLEGFRISGTFFGVRIGRIILS